MLTYKNVRITYALLSSAALIGYLIYGGWLLYAAVGLALVYLGLIVYGVFAVRAGFFLPLYNAADTAERCVALTFDDGPTEQTYKVLDILKRYNIRGTFFLIGNRAEAHPQVLQRLVEEGHQFGNHTYHHSTSTGFYSVEKLEEEITSTTQLVQKLSGKKMTFYRPPFGVTTPRLAKVVSQLQLKVIGWSVRSFDTTGKPAEKIAQRILRQVRPGAVVLMHDDREKCTTILETIIPQLQQQQYTFATVGELFKMEAYEND